MLGSILFWTAVGVLVYQYVGYPLALAAIARLRGPRDRISDEGGDTTPSVSLVISAYDEEEVIARKLENALSLDYPRDRLEIVVASDGSRDRTEEIARGFADRGVVLHAFRPNRGKNMVLNDVLPLLRGDVVVFTDANGQYRPDAIRHLVRPFSDPRVGSVCGELVYKNFNDNAIAEGYNRYWELDQMQKRLESRLGSLLGANGSIFAVRRSLCRPIANDVCNDMVQPIWVAAAGHLCLYEPRALSHEAGSRDLGDELKRRSRIIGRGIRGIQLVWPEIVDRRAWLVGWELLSRKGLRYLTPLWLAMILVGSALAPGVPYKLAFLAQILVYACVPLGFVLRGGPLMRIVSPATYFGIGSLAAVLGWWKILSGSELGRWQTADRPFETGSPGTTGTAGPG